MPDNNHQGLDRHPRGAVPADLPRSQRTGTWLYVILWILDIGLIIAGAIAYGLTETDYEPGLKLVFPELGLHVQRLEIAMVGVSKLP